MSTPAISSLVATASKAVTRLVSRVSQPTTPTSAVPPSPGSFRHPQLTEIIQRQAAASLTSQKVQNAFLNIAAMALTFLFRATMTDVLASGLIAVSIPPTILSAATLIGLLRLLFLANAILCLRPALPYISRSDHIADISLTPSQRALLGLAPSIPGSPAITNSSTGYITPPRYRRDGGMNTAAALQNSPWAQSTGRRSTSANYSSSPISTSRYTVGFSPNNAQSSPGVADRQRVSDSSYLESSAGSPLFQKTISTDLGQSTFGVTGFRANSSTNNSLVGIGASKSQVLRERVGGREDAASLPGTPSPSGPRRQPGVNYKWLYDKGAR